MISIAAVTSGKNLSSTRFRIRQHIKPLSAHGMAVTEFCPPVDKYAPIPFFDGRVNRRLILPIYGAWLGVKLTTRIPAIIGSYKHQITWLGREFLPGYPTLEGLLKRPLVLDVDDAIWMTRPFGETAVRHIARFADAVIVGNQYLANWFEPQSKKIRIIPTAIDSDRFKPCPAKTLRKCRFILGWTGSSVTLPYLESIETPLRHFLKDYPDAELNIMADRFPQFEKIKQEKVNFEPWSPEKEAGFLEQLDVGLMPIPDNPWAKGKCAFKMLLYMSAKKPVIASPIGMNSEVFSLGNIGIPAAKSSDWYEGLVFLYHNQKQAQSMGAAGRDIILKYFDRRVITEQIAEVFFSLI